MPDTGNGKLFRSGFVPITGLPNAGKSTLLNLLCSAGLSIISEKPQTTRNNILGILNGRNFQAVFIDTPGFLKARNLFEKSMEHSIKRASLEGGDVCVLVAEPDIPPEAKLPLFGPLNSIRCPLFLAVNKTDRFPMEKAEKAAEFFKGLLPVARTFFISAATGAGTGPLRSAIESALPEHEPYYPRDQITDRWERFYAAEIIRGQIYRLYAKEIPYASAVEIETFREHEGRPDEILAAVHVARNSQKPILIGKGGRAVRILRERAEKEIASFLGRKIDLQIHVKVTPDWQNNPQFLKEIGFYEKK